MNSSLARLLLCTAFASLATACVEPALEKDDGEPFTIGTPGKADGTGLVSPEEMARIEAAFDQAVTSGQAAIEKLEVEIAALEVRHAEQQAKAAGLVQGIAAREDELEEVYNRNLFLCLFIPNPSTCVFANYLANDSTLQKYKAELAAAKEEQQKINADIEAYRIKRDDLRVRIENTRTGKTNLLAMLRDDRAPSVSPALADSPATGKAFWRADTMTKIDTAIRKELGLLVELRDAAADLAEDLEASLTTLRALEQSVDALVQEARGQFMELLKGFVSGDPDAVAQQWLDDVLARRTGEILETLDFPHSEFARYLVTSDGTTEGADELVGKLLQQMFAGSGLPSITFNAPTSVAILDNTPADKWSWSRLDISERREISLLEVYVDIEHPHIGDLEVVLGDGTNFYWLSDNLGGPTDNMVRTFVVPAAEGHQLAGPWTLWVRDTRATDTGTLKGWQLIAR